MNRSTLNWLVLFSGLALIGSGCGPEHHARGVQSGLEGDRLTVGKVQREIRKGMSGAEVAEALGSPNVVSTDPQGLEVWIYDKFATDVVASSSGWSIFGAGAGVGNGGGGVGGLGASGGSGAASSSQRTLTVVIKFDEKKHVRDFAYHSSRF